MTNLTPSLRLSTQANSLSARKPLRFGLFGAGAMGRHHARVLTQLVGVELVGVSDLDVERGREVCRQVGVDYFEASADLLERCDAVVVATPTATHYSMALPAIQSGKHVLIEKPLADSVERARELALAASQSQSRCVVGHVERFNPVVRWFRQSIEPSEILSINVSRVGPRPPRVKDVGIVIDLAVHDIDLISYLCQSSIDSIQAFCKSTNGSHEDVAQISIRTMSGAVCGINTNWLTPYKSRKIEIATKGGFFVGDLVTGSITSYQADLQAGDGKYTAQCIVAEGLEPLLEQAASFAAMIQGESDCENASIDEACKVVELADRCLKFGRLGVSQNV